MTVPPGIEPLPRCPHLQPGTTAYASVMVGGTAFAVCSHCFVFTRRARQDLNFLVQKHGVSYPVGGQNE